MDIDKFISEQEKIKNTDFPSKIHINCGYCGLMKGCKIRKSFIETAKEFTKKGIALQFDLKCPFEEAKYKDGCEIEFTVAYGAHKVIKEWECDLPDYDGTRCDSCNFSDNCYDGLVKFRNKRYKGNVKLTGNIYGYIGKGKYIIEVSHKEFEKVKHNFNRYDLMILHKISDNFGWCGYDFIPYFVTKQKFILK